jgi:hypothetical protein
VKAEIVLESYRDSCSVADVARKHGVSGPQLHAWRRAAREGVLAMPDDDILGLVPVVVEASGSGVGGGHPADPSGVNGSPTFLKTGNIKFPTFGGSGDQSGSVMSSSVLVFRRASAALWRRRRGYRWELSKELGLSWPWLANSLAT